MKDSTNPVREKDKKDELSLFLKAPITHVERVARGGDWEYCTLLLPLMLRHKYFYATNKEHGIGFRLVKNKGKT
jgi:formylglycine-generating enzyme required for sulfatase activity